MLTQEIQAAIKKMVLCWLATVDEQGYPNVSPKEMFLVTGEQEITIAHVASPQSIHNIQQNQQVCVSLVDVFVQKGYKIKGKASILPKTAPHYAHYLEVFQEAYGTAFPITAFITIQVQIVAPIVAPSYAFFPDQTTATTQIKGALETYQVRALLKGQQTKD